MNPNYRTLHNDIGMIQRTNNGWDLWFDNGDLVKADDFHSLQVGIIIACLTSWNYMNRYGNPTYEVFGNRAYELLKANKGNMVAYKIQQYFIECLKRMRRVYEVVYVSVSEVPSQPYAYYVKFEVISINNQLVDGSFTVTTDVSKSSSYIDYDVLMPYASNENPLVIDLYLMNEYGGGLEGEVVYMYIQKGDGNYEFMGVVGRTDETGYLRVTYEPVLVGNECFDVVNGSKRVTHFSNNDANTIYFDFHGNSTYNPSTSQRRTFKTEMFEYYVEFLNDDITTKSEYNDLTVRLRKKSLLDGSCSPMDYTPVTVNGNDGKDYTAVTDPNGEATIRVKISKNTEYTISYNDVHDSTNVTIIKTTPWIEFTTTASELYYGEPLELMASVTDEEDNPISGVEVAFKDGENEISVATTDDDGVAILSRSSFPVGEHGFSAIVKGTDWYNQVGSERILVDVIKHTPTVDLSVQEPPLIVGNEIDFTATVSEGEAMLYDLTVRFTDENNVVLGDVVCKDGVATLTIGSLDIGEHTVTATVVGNDYYNSNSDSVDIEVLDNDYSLEIVGELEGIVGNTYNVGVNVILKDNGIVVDGVSFGNNPLRLIGDTTGDEWTLLSSDSNHKFTTSYTLSDGDDTSELEFLATWGDISATYTIELPSAETHILLKRSGGNNQVAIFIGYLHDENNEGIGNQEIHISFSNGEETTATTVACGYFQFNCPDPGITTMTLNYGGDGIHSGCTRTMAPNDEQDTEVIPLIKVKVEGGWLDNVLIIRRCYFMTTRENLSEWEVDVYDENDTYVTTLDQSNNTYQATSQFEAKVVIKTDCEKGILRTERIISPL